MDAINNISKEDMLTLYHKLGSFENCAKKIKCSARAWAQRWADLDCEDLIECKDFMDPCIKPKRGEGCVNANSYPKKKVASGKCKCSSCDCDKEIIEPVSGSGGWANSVSLNGTCNTYSTFDISKYIKENATLVPKGESERRVFWEKEATPLKSEYDPSSERYEIAFVSDMHFGSIHQQLTVLNNFVELCHERDIRTLLNGGDISEGLMPRVGAKNDRFLHVIDDLTDYCVENLPDGFDVNAFILGNHDDSMGTRCDGFDIGKAVEMARGDLTYLKSTSLPDIIKVDGGINVQLFHGTGGCTKFRSTRTQNKTVELMAMSRQPDIIAFGHCHLTSMIPRYCGTYVYGLGCFQSQTKYLGDKMMEPDVCGLIVGYNINETTGKMVNVSPEFVYAEELGGLRENDFT
jgi:predicted phosphodiesterase